MKSQKIVSVKSLGEVPTMDITVDNDHHLFYANDGIITSNSHAYTYSAISAAEFWLKYNYITEYMTALLNNTAPNKKKHGSDVLIDYIKYSRSKDIQIKSPDINKSKDKFTIEGIFKNHDGVLSLPPSTRAIRFSLRHIKRVSNSSTFIVESAPYKSMDDFYERINRRKVNKGVMMNLISSGSFDEFGRDIYIENEIEEKRELYSSGVEKAFPNMSESKIRKVNAELDAMKKFWKRRLSGEEISIDKIRNAAVVRYFELRADKKDGEPPIKNEKEWHQLEIDVMGICLSREPIFEKYKEYMVEKKYLTNSKYSTNVSGIFLGRVEKVNSFKAKISQKNHFIISMTDDSSEITFYVWEGDRKSWTKKVKLGDIVAVPLKSFKNKETGEVDLSSKKFYDSRYNIDVVERNI